MDLTIEIYAYLFSSIFLISIIMKITLKLSGKYDKTPKSVQIEEVLFIPFYCIGLVAMFGYVYDRYIFVREFWQVYTVCLMLSVMGSFWLPKLKWIKSHVSKKAYLLTVIIGNVIALPYFYMVIVYAFLEPWGIPSA